MSHSACGLNHKAFTAYHALRKYPAPNCCFTLVRAALAHVAHRRVSARSCTFYFIIPMTKKACRACLRGGIPYHGFCFCNFTPNRPPSPLPRAHPRWLSAGC